MTAPVSFYADPQALASLKHESKAQDPETLKEAAKQFESLFTKMMLKSMREANKSFGDSMFGSDQADFYQGMFDDQMAVHLSKGRGLGLADMLFRQLTTGSLDSSAIDGQRPLPNPPPATGGGNRSVAPLTSSAGSAVFPSSVSNSSLPAPSAAGSSHFPPPVAGGGQGGGSSTHAPLSTSKADFIRSMLPHAKQVARELGVDPHALLAQAALETGWGKSVPCNANGECSYNLFGIKATGRWSGASVSVPTLEFEDGIPVRKAERFRAYESPADSFRDYAALIRNNPRYENALGAGSDVTTFATALQEGGYATDPNYANKIVAVAKELRAFAANDQVKSADDLPIASYAGVRP